MGFLDPKPLSAAAANTAYGDGVYVAEASRPRQPDISSMAQTFASGHGWVNFSSTAATVADDTVDFALGSRSLKFTTKTDNTAGSVQKTGLAIDLTGKQVILWVKVTGAANLTELILYAGDSTLANTYSWTIGDAGGIEQHVFREGQWAPIVLSFADAAATGTPNRNAIATLRVRARATTGNSVTVNLGGIGTTPEPKAFPNGVISFTCDDSYASQFNVMRPTLDKYGWNATAYTIVDVIGTSGFMTLNQLKTLEQSHGWEIAGHSYTSSMHSAGYGSGSTTEAIETDIRALRKWLLANKFKGADHLAYPRGYFTTDTQALMGKYFATGRTVTNRLSETLRPSDRMRLRSLSVTNTIPLSTAKALVDKVKAGKGWGIITIHDLVTTPTVGAHWAAADFTALVEYIAAQGIPVMNVSEVTRRLDHLDSVKDTSTFATKTELKTAATASRHVGDTNGIQTYSALSDGVATNSNSEIRHNLDTDISEIQYVYENANLLADGPNNITVRAGMYLNGAWLPMYFGGQRDIVIPPGGRAITDPVPISIAGAAFFESRTKVSVSTVGEKWPITYACSATRSEWAVDGTGAEDYTTSGALASNSNNAFAPTAILAKAKTHSDTVALIGDSITWGTGAASPTWFNSFSRLACAAKGKVSINVGMAGSASSIGYGFAFIRRSIPIVGASHSIEMYGTNDFGSTTLATLQARLISCWRDRAARSIRVYACTLIPRVTSTDSYATTTNQTDATGNTTVRVPLNDWLRAGAPVDPSTFAPVAIGTAGALVAGNVGHPLVGYFDTADAVESARNSGKWKVDGTANKYTADGVHPSAFGHQAMADAIVAQWPAVF